MKIVHVEDFIHPDAGYQVNLLSRLQKAEGHDVTIVTGELDKAPSYLVDFFGKDDIKTKDLLFERQTGVPIIRVPLLGFYSGRAIFRPRLFKVVSDLKPDVVFVHGEDTLTGILFIWSCKWLNYPIVLDCHMLEMASENRFREYFRAFYKKFVTPIILREKIPLIRVMDSDFVEKCLGIPLSYTDLLSFGTDTSYFKPCSETRMAVRKRLGLGEKAFLILYAGKMDQSKGGALLAEALQRKLSTGGGDTIEFLVIGRTEGEYGQRVEQRLGESENRIVRLPTQRYYDLAQYYQAADLAVFPRQCSMSFFEAQSCGLPVLFEENEINNQRASFGNAFLFKSESVEDFRRKMVEIASLPADQHRKISANARGYVLESYDYVPIARRFTEVLLRAIEQRRQKLASP